MSQNKAIIIIYSTPLVDAVSLLLLALQKLGKDDKFKSRSPAAVDILQAASTLSQWCTDEIHRLELTKFSVAVIEDLNSCFESCSTLTTKKEKMWSNFHHVRMSPSYHKKWITFLNASVGSCSTSILQILHLTYS